jgi:hypothetical protein
MASEDDELRRRYLESKRGDLTAYAGMIGEEFSTKLNRLAQIIGTSHEPSIGRYKESVLRNCIEQFIPKRYSVGTGFIAFTRESPLYKQPDNELKQRDDYIDLLNRKELYISSQLDIIIFDDYNFSPIFRDAEFVVVRPESVRAVVEVKGYLNKISVISAIESFVDLGRKWKEYSEYNPQWECKELHTPAFHLMGMDVHVGNANKRAACNGRLLRKTIVETYRKHLNNAELEGDSIPLLSGAYIYNDCIVTLSRHSIPYQSNNLLGYSTYRGRFVRYDENLKPYLDRDSTISSLLASIYAHLETPFNQDFAYFDQASTISVLPHRFSGSTELISGEEL